MGSLSRNLLMSMVMGFSAPFGRDVVLTNPYARGSAYAPLNPCKLPMGRLGKSVERFKKVKPCLVCGAGHTHNNAFCSAEHSELFHSQNCGKKKTFTLTKKQLSQKRAGLAYV